MIHGIRVMVYEKGDLKIRPCSPIHLCFHPFILSYLCFHPFTIFNTDNALLLLLSICIYMYIYSFEFWDENLTHIILAINPASISVDFTISIPKSLPQYKHAILLP